MMLEHFGCTIDDLRVFLINGLRGAWIDDGSRRQWVRDWLTEFDTLRSRLVT